MIGLLTLNLCANRSLVQAPRSIPVSGENALHRRALLCLRDIPPPPILTLARRAALV